MFQSLSDHHQGVCKFLMKITELKLIEMFLVVMRQHNL
jgi:hypothetical protein